MSRILQMKNKNSIHFFFFYKNQTNISFHSAKFNNNNSGRTKRTVDFTEFPACDRANFNEVMRCYKAGKPQLITLTCRILRSPHCSYKVSCKTVIQNNNNRYQCPDPVHSMTQIHCCKPKCSI